MNLLILLVFIPTFVLLIFLLYLQRRYYNSEGFNKLTMYRPTTVANYFIQNYAKYGALTPMKLIKLTYIAHGWYLALNDGEEGFVNDRLEAWEFGPVFPSLYQNLKKNGKTIITEPIKTSNDESLSVEDAKFLDKIWSMYGKYDGVKLSAMTHTAGTPWERTFVYGQNKDIPNSLITDYYKKFLEVAYE